MVDTSQLESEEITDFREKSVPLFATKILQCFDVKRSRTNLKTRNENMIKMCVLRSVGRAKTLVRREGSGFASKVPSVDLAWLQRDGCHAPTIL